MLFRMYARSFLSTASRPRRTDSGYLVPMVKHKKAMPRTKRSLSISVAERFIRMLFEDAVPLYSEIAGRCGRQSQMPSMISHVRGQVAQIVEIDRPIRKWSGWD